MCTRNEDLAVPYCNLSSDSSAGGSFILLGYTDLLLRRTFTQVPHSTQIYLRYGVVANIIASHAIARGSIPRVGIAFGVLLVYIFVTQHEACSNRSKLSRSLLLDDYSLQSMVYNNTALLLLGCNRDQCLQSILVSLQSSSGPPPVHQYKV